MGVPNSTRTGSAEATDSSRQEKWGRETWADACDSKAVSVPYLHAAVIGSSLANSG